MADILSIGKTAQDAIDNFIDLWLTGLDVLTGGDPAPDVKAPMPFYCAGKGAWMSYNNNISGVEGENYGWSYAMCDWQVYSKDSTYDLHVDCQYGGIENPSRPASWNAATMSYWNKDNNRVMWNVDDAYIINNQIDYFGYVFSSDGARPSAVAGYRIVGNSTEEYKDLIFGEWRKYDDSVLAQSHMINIINSNTIPDYNGYYFRDSPNPMSNNMFNLNRYDDSFWVTVMPSSGNTTIENNFYDQTEHHNTNNQYLTDNSVDNYYNTYEINLPDGLGFNIGVGGGGFNISPVTVPVGVAPIIAPELDFDDLIDILTPIVDDLNDNTDYNLQLHDFDYYLSRYKDYGDFYIKPLHQYDKLPKAQTFDGTIDLGDYPRVIGESVNTYMGLLPAGISVLLSAVFIIAIILDNLRGRR